MRFLFSRFGLVGSLVLAGCGSRSGLQDPLNSGTNGGGGAGGAPTPGTGGGPNEGGGGGTPQTTCVLERHPVVVASPEEIGLHATRPRLIQMGDGRVVVAHARELVQGPTPSEPDLVHAPLKIWGNWPPEWSMSRALAETGGFAAPQTFVVSEERGLGAYYGLLYTTGNTIPTPPLDTVELATLVAPDEGYIPGPPSVSQTNAGPDQKPLFLAPTSSGFIAAKTFPEGPYEKLALIRADAGGYPFSGQIESGCGIGPLAGDGLAFGEGVLVAFSSAAPWFGCYMDDVNPATPPNRLQVGLFGDVVGFESKAEIQGTDPIRQIEVVARKDGAWVVWQENGASAFQMPGVLGQAFDASGDPAGEPVILVSEGVVQTPFAATATGDNGLLLTWFEATDSPSPLLVVGLFRADGKLVTGESFTPEPRANPEQLDVKMNATTREIVVAWADLPVAPSRVRLAQLHCASSD